MSVSVATFRRVWRSLVSTRVSTASKHTEGPIRNAYSSTPLVSCLHVPDWTHPYRLITDTLSADQLAAFRTLVPRLSRRAASDETCALKRLKVLKESPSDSASHLTQRPNAIANSKLITSDQIAANESIANQVVAKLTQSQLGSSVWTRFPRITPVGQSVLLFIRSPLSPSLLKRLSRALRSRRPRSLKLATRLNATTGMAIAATLGTEPHSFQLPQSIVRLLASTEGPHRIGIGWIPRSWHTILAAICAILLLTSLVATLSAQPQLAPWFVTICAIMFATRPDLMSFFRWTRYAAPYVASQKTLWVDKVRATLAPYMLQLVKRPTLTDYGLFSIVVAVDTADYVYVYAGVMSRWCLLGWYNRGEVYDFDALATAT